ncbi:MAG: hypothetical protein K0S33_2782 [Bacteroidetes bacterium]|jgi:hypothetical protein|nr:hypothetical protein [Bacteroidota bacterium]
MKQVNKLLMILTLAVIFASCEKDIIVKDITGKTITVLAPGDGVSTPINTITFWWERVDGAEKYNLQIVSPSFTSITQLIADTNVTGDKFVQTLQPGTYQWRIRATNNGGSTPWVTRTLTIDTTSNLSFLTVALNSPADSFYTNVLSQTFSWSPISAATAYRIQITGTTFDNLQTGTSAAYTFPSTNATYTWMVRAENNTGFTQFSSRKIFIDVTAPGLPTLYSPANTFTSTVTLGSDSIKWIRGSGGYYDSLYVSTDSMFINPFVLQRITATTTPVGYAITLNNGFSTAQRYYWKVKSIDKAGNQSAFTSRFQFKTN